MSSDYSKLKFSIEDYSENAIAVFGDTKEISARLASLGGKFNPVLKGIGEQRRPGWIFSKKRREEVDKLISQVRQEIQSGSFVAAIEPHTKAPSSVKTPSSSSSEDKSNAIISSLLSRVELLETELATLKRIVLAGSAKSTVASKPAKDWADQSEDESEEEEEKEPVAPVKRLLSNYKARK